MTENVHLPAYMHTHTCMLTCSYIHTQFHMHVYIMFTYMHTIKLRSIEGALAHQQFDVPEVQNKQDIHVIPVN